MTYSYEVGNKGLRSRRSEKGMAVRKNQTQGRLAAQRTGRLEQHPRLRPWHDAFAALLDYRKRYGDCRVPSRWPKNRWLGKWVARMRRAKKENRLTKDKIRELDQIGFSWSIDHRSIIHRQHTWKERFKELEAFKKKHGHCNVPRSYPLNQPLAYWVDKQRSSKRKGELDMKRIRRLNELGFCWSLLHRRFRRRDLGEFVALVTAFKKRHGHCDFIVTRERLDPDFKMWMVDVRKSKKQGRLDPQRVRQLDRLGFVWEPRKQRRQDFYSALLDYRKRYGDCRVPSKWPENRSLAKWMERKRAAKKQNLLTKAQIRELDEIGFCWNMSKVKESPRKPTGKQPLQKPKKPRAKRR